MVLNPKVVLAAASLGSAAAGSALTYVIVKQRLEKKFDEIAKAEVKEARQFYARLYKADEFADIPSYENGSSEDESEELTDEEVAADVTADDVRQAALDIAVKKAGDAGYVDYNKISTAPKQTEEEKAEVVASQRRNIFEKSQGIVETEEYDQAKEHEKRDQGLPYVITDVDFYEDETHVKYTFEYYEGDDVITDENGAPIDSEVADRNVGLSNLRFGYGVPNKNTVLIHNPKSDVMYEIVRNVGNFYEESGMETPGFRVGKFRDSDD